MSGSLRTQVGQLAQDQPHRLVVGVLVVAGVGADTGGARHKDTRRVAEMVADPTTRVPS